MMHWFLPETPDVLGQLRRQVAITIEGIDAFGAWAAGDEGAADLVAEAERRADTAKRDLLNELRAAFVTPVDPEDLFAISRGTDWILNHARDVIRESAVLDCPPDDGLATMAATLREAVRQLGMAIDRLGTHDDPVSAADAAIARDHELEQAYFEGMAALLDLDDRAARIARRELYRRCAEIGETVVDVAERVVYTVVKQT